MSSYGERAKELFCQGYNCSQAVLLAFKDECGMDSHTLLKISSSFGGGMGRMREVCGAVSGMFMVAGLLCGYTSPDDNKAKTEHYALIKALADKFKALNGSIICAELLGLKGDVYSPKPDNRSQEYYKKRPCAQLVSIAADIIYEHIATEKLKRELN